MQGFSTALLYGAMQWRPSWSCQSPALAGTQSDVYPDIVLAHKVFLRPCCMIPCNGGLADLASHQHLPALHSMSALVFHWLKRCTRMLGDMSAPGISGMTDHAKTSSCMHCYLSTVCRELMSELKRQVQWLVPAASSAEQSAGKAQAGTSLMQHALQ